MLARDVIATAPSLVELVARDSAALDVTDPAAVHAAIDEIAPHVVINCAAYTNVDGAESDRERAFAVNGHAPGYVARAVAHRSDTVLIHYGTDYVFDGTASRPYREEDPCAPAGVYGASKLAGEQRIAEHKVRALILRTQWLYGVHGRSFPRTMWERATAGLATKVVNDQTGRLTYTVDLARATWCLIALERQGRGVSAPRGRILHIANTGQGTWYEVARHVFERLGKPELVTPCTTADYPRPAKRPAWSVLDTSRFDAFVDRPLPGWKGALDRFLDQVGTAGS